MNFLHDCRAWSMETLCNFIFISFLFYLFFSLLLKRFIVLEDSISPVLSLKRTFLCRFTSQEMLAKSSNFGRVSLQPVELYYISPVFLF